MGECELSRKFKQFKKILALLLIAALVIPTGWVVPVLANSETQTVYHETIKNGDGAAQHSGETLSESNEIAFYDFEDGVQGWAGRGDASVSVTNDGYDGSQALKTTGRTAGWHGPSINVSNLMEKGATYEVSGYAKLVEGQSPSGMKLSANQPGAGNEFPNISGTTPLQVTDSAWVEFKGEYTYDLSATSVSLYFESDNSTVEFIVDNVKVVQTAPAPDFGDDGDLDQSGVFSDFEDGVQGWVPRGSGYNVVATDADAFDGSQSLLTNAPEQYQGPLLDVMGKMHPGHIYDLSVWVKMAEGQPDTSVRISVQSGSSSFTNVSSDTTATDEEWVQLSGRFTLNSAPSVLNAYVELVNQPESERLFYIDNFELKHIGKVQSEDRPTFNGDLPSIYETYQDQFLIGNAITMNEFQGVRLEHLKHHHNLITAENVMKPEYYYNRATGEFDFADQDEFVNAAVEEDLKIHGHVLVWHEQSRPELHTVNGTPLSREEALANMETHIETVMTRYGNKVMSWDVVNEAIVVTSNPSEEWEKSLRDTGWKRAIGDDYVEQAFRIAKKIVDKNGWDMKLYYNDYNDHIKEKAEIMYHMVKDINERYAKENPGEVLISGLGMQGHYNEFTNPDTIRASLELFTSLEGVEIGVTELDITSGSADSPQTEAEEIRQAQLYAQLFQIYKEYSNEISRVTFWGLDDGASWRGERTPLLFKSNLQPKLAYHAVVNPEKFLEDYPLGGRVYRQGEAVYGTPEINGTIDSVWDNAPTLLLDRVSGAWNVRNGYGKVLWDEENLYVMIQVYGANLDKSATNAHEQDSVEVFLDRENLKTSSYQDGIAQYRVNFDNEASFNPGTDVVRQGFESATKITGNDYVVEMKIPFNETTPEDMKKIGLDLQINYANNGQRANFATWNDITGQGWNDPSVFGVITLVAPEQDPGTEDPGTNPGEEPGTDKPGQGNGNRPDTPPGLEKRVETPNPGNGNKPATPPGQSKRK